MRCSSHLYMEIKPNMADDSAADVASNKAHLQL